MEGPAPTAETIGRYSGEVVESFKNFGMGITGAASMNAAIASWKAGNYGTAALQGMQSLGEAGTTVFGFGAGSTLRYGATTTSAEWAAARQTYAVEGMQFSGGLPVLEGSAYSPGVVNARSMEFYKSYGQNPLHGTMQNLEARQWYLVEDAKILTTVDQSASIEMQARQAFDLRNANRLQTRDMMADRITADRLMREEPNMTWEKMVSRRKSEGLSGEDLYRSILESSQKTRPSVNKFFGLEK